MMRFAGVSTFAIYISVSILIINVSSQFLKTIGESCDGDCDEGLGLTCLPDSKVCVCMNPNATTFEKSRSTCVTKAGHPCRRVGGENDCVSHASCQGLNLPCQCDKNYFQTRNGTCLQAAKYREACSPKKQCDKTAGMECVGIINSKNKQFQCQCKYPRDQYFDSEQNQCISYANGNCTFGLTCVKNAGCNEEILELRKGETLRGKSYYYNASVGLKCACKEGFRMTKNRFCLPTYNSPCDDNDNNNVCNAEENLKCFDNKICLCQNPLQQVYDLKSHKCQGLVGSKCTGVSVSSQNSSSRSINNCVTGSECKNSRCTCNVGFSETPSRKCLKSYGETCRSEECNFYRGLACNNGTCDCFDEFLTFNQDKQACLGSEGSICGSSSLLLESGQLTWNFNPDGCSKTSGSVKLLTVNCNDGLECRFVNGYNQCLK